ncbi:MAG: lysoplasmalogenase [Chloroflexi bacterium]|nr:lysoplasmalogenase [Chloroflexota bacterium]
MIVIPIFLSILALVSGALTIVAKYRKLQRLEFIFKPLTLFWIILIALLAQDPISTTYQRIILLALLASLAGDMYLLLPDKFIQGLISFLIAHCFYIVAFSSEIDHYSQVWYLIPFVVYGGVILWWLWPYLGPMKFPVVFYVCIILIMASQAGNRWLQASQNTSAILALAGAYLFLASDSVLAVERFRGTWRSAPFWVLTTYFAAQWLLALSI